MPVIYCVPLDGFPREGLIDLAAELANALNYQVAFQEGFSTFYHTHDPNRGQHDSTAILELLLRMPHDPGDRVLGVTLADLFIPIFTFVFGEAQLDGQAAVVSTRRLHNEYYG
ncbi:hypothetical protein ACFLZR_02165, partial [Candidatus Neomarinimicrobiota bacterium]